MAARKSLRSKPPLFPTVLRPRVPFPEASEPRAATLSPYLIVAVDTAKYSGWCYRHSESTTITQVLGATSGVVFANDLAAVNEVVRGAVKLGILLDIPDDRIVLVMETYWGGKRHTIFGLGKAHGVWEATWKANGLVDRRVVKVKPATWRQKVLGRSRGMLHPSEQRRAKVALGYDPQVCPDLPQDQAAAVCIAEWASVSPQVSSRLPRQRAKKALKRKAV